MTELTIASFNIRNSRGLDGRNIWWLRRRNTLRVIQSLQADVICFQEVRRGQLRWLRTRLQDYELVGIARDDGASRGEHLVIAARRKVISVHSSEARWFSGTPEAPSRVSEAQFNRMAVIAEISIEGEAVKLVNTHLEERHEAVRAGQIQMLAKWFPGNAILVGDFNTTVDDLALEPLWRAGYSDALDTLPPGGPGLATHHSFTGTRDGTRIDHIFVPQSVKVITSGIVHDRPHGPLPSDHWPVVAKIEVSPIHKQTQE